MSQLDITKLVQKYDWEKRWMERFTLYTTSLVGHVYFYGCQEQLGVSFSKNVFIYKEGMVTCYQLVSENTSFGTALAKQLEDNPALVATWNQEVKSAADTVLALMTKYDGVLFETAHCHHFEEVFRNLQPPFVRMTRVANYLNQSFHPLVLPSLNVTRLATETVYGKVDYFVRRSLRGLGEKLGIDPALIEQLYHFEVYNYVTTGILPSDTELATRSPISGLFFENGIQYFLSAEQCRLFERAVTEKNISADGVVRGATSMPGIAHGVVRVIFDPKKYETFNEGDILVTNMTYPEFVPLMKKSGAIVTDAGGVLCHAAIVARELKKPCVTNTQFATNILRNGEVVEVDATNGIIRKIS